MRKYLGTLHIKSDNHKKRFALLVSSAFTLLIFGIWSLTTFGGSYKTVLVEKEEVGPLQSLSTNLAASFEVFRNNFKELKDRALDFYAPQ